jgi:hypothetical protein
MSKAVKRKRCYLLRSRTALLCSAVTAFTLCSSEQCEALSPERIAELHQEVRDFLAHQGPYAIPRDGEICFISMTFVAALTPRADRVWAAAFKTESLKPGRDGWVSDDFMNRVVANSGGTLLKLQTGCRVRVTKYVESGLSKIVILSGSQVGKSCYVGSDILAKLDRMKEANRTPEEKEECARYIMELQSGSSNVRNLSGSAKSRFDHLKLWAGKYPIEKNGRVTTSFFDVPEIRQPLMQLLKSRNFTLLTKLYDVQTPIELIGDYLAVKDGRSHNVWSDNAALCIDLRDGSVYVMMCESGSQHWFCKGKITDLPDDVRNYMSDFSAE